MLTWTKLTFLGHLYGIYKTLVRLPECQMRMLWTSSLGHHGALNTRQVQVSNTLPIKLNVPPASSTVMSLDPGGTLNNRCWPKSVIKQEIN